LSIADDLAVTDVVSAAVTGTLRTARGHEVDPAFLAYHRTHIADTRA